MKNRWLLTIVLAIMLGVNMAHGQGRKSLEPRDGLVCLLVNRNSGRCLSVSAGSVEPGAKIVQGPMPADAGPSEQWKLIAAGEAFQLRNEKSGLMLEIGSNNMNKGVQAIQWQSQALPQQRWTFEPMDDAFVMRVGHSQLVLGVAMGKIEQGARVIQWNHVPTVSDQLWQLRSTQEDEAAPEAEAGNSLGGWFLVVLMCTGIVFLLALALIAGLVLHLRRRAPVAPRTKTNAEPILSATCTSCGVALKVKPDLVGKKVKCTKCGAIVHIPRPAAAQVST
jgi:predicted RNA-binding Zn-ribbon protein involved in translation (DUF1610 family)